MAAFGATADFAYVANENVAELQQVIVHVSYCEKLQEHSREQL